MAKAAGLAGLVATPVLDAVKEFADLGRSLVEGSDRLGTTVEQLDAMHYAAEQAGVGAETLEAGIVRMNRATADSPEALAKLGINAQQFAGLPLEQKFGAIADGISGLGDQAQQTSAVMGIFGRGGAALLPMFKEGSEGISKATEEARRLGLVMSGEDAKKAAELGKAFDRLKAVIHRTFLQLGAALLPVFEKIRATIDEKIGNLQSLQKLIRNNAGLITSFLQIAKIVLKVAAGWAALRFAVTQAGNVLSLASMGLSAVGAVLGFLLSPIGLVTAALVGLGALWLTQTEDGRKLAGEMADGFDEMGERLNATWGGIRASLQSGDLALAARIGGAELEVEWARTMAHMKDGWASMIYVLKITFNEFTDYFSDAGFDLGITLGKNVFSALKGLLEALPRVAQDAARRAGLGAVLDADEKTVMREVDRRAAAAKKQDRADRVLRDKLAGDHLDEDRERANKEVADAKAKLDALLKEAAAKNLGDGVLGQGEGMGYGLRPPETPAAAAVKGTFQSAGAERALAFADSTAQKQLKEQQRTNALLEDIDEKAGGGLAFGQ